MELSEGEDNAEPLIFTEELIVTNSSFINTPEVTVKLNKECIKNTVEDPRCINKDGCTISHSENCFPEIEMASTVASAIKQLFGDCHVDLCPSKFFNIAAIFTKTFSKLNKLDVITKISGLSGHVGVCMDGHPWMDLEAGYILELHQNKRQPSASRKISCPPLPNQIQIPLELGQYVPMQHILHGLTIAKFDKEYAAKYNINIMQPLPKEFIYKIKRIDVIRGANIHCLLLGTHFPIISASFPGFIDELWNFMFVSRYKAVAGMELYNEFFYEFSRQLGLGILLSLDHIPNYIIESVSSKHVPDLPKCF